MFRKLKLKLKNRYYQWLHKRLLKKWPSNNMVVSEYVYPVEMVGDHEGRPIFLSVELTVEMWDYFKGDSLSTMKSLCILHYTLNYLGKNMCSKTINITISSGLSIEEQRELIRSWLPIGVKMLTPRPKINHPIEFV